jgi:hypothetical protein
MAKEGIRLLKAGEIECRVATINAKGLSILLYKDARVDQRILDETFGHFGWKRSHQCIDGNLYCTVEVYDKEKGIWVSKQDVGTMGYTEKEKSQASDSFKRACFNWGIGRELYSAPFIWIPAAKVNIQSRGDKFYCNEYFTVASISYNSDREISSLTIVNRNNQILYEMRAKQEGEGQNYPAETRVKNTKSGLSENQMTYLKQELQRTGVKMQTVQNRYKVEKPEEMSQELYEIVMTALRRTKSAQVA